MSSTPASRPILIVGLQKSGTSLLSRLLQDTGIAVNPFRGEGDAFWGNTPPFAPTGFPAGVLYQRHDGEAGHTLGAAEATAEIRSTLRQRLAQTGASERLLVNKNPYNTVRVPWLRALFPQALIVAVVRAALPTAYSLTKKHVPHEGRGREPEEGWWGVKPRRWRELRDEDTLVQTARQWAAVTRQLLDARDDLDRIVSYPQLCADPAAVLGDICRCATGREPPLPLELQPLRCFDDEHRRGSRLQSKNRYYHETGTLQIPSSEPLELPALDGARVELVERLTADTERELRAQVQLDVAER
jgi:hypothetical protein